MWTYRPPTVEEGPATWTDPLFYRVRLTRGVTVLEQPPGEFRAARFPTEDELAAAHRYWMGGHEHEVDDATKEALIASGLADESSFVFPVYGYGGGAYGAGPFGG